MRYLCVHTQEGCFFLIQLHQSFPPSQFPSKTHSVYLNLLPRLIIIYVYMFACYLPLKVALSLFILAWVCHCNPFIWVSSSIQYFALQWKDVAHDRNSSRHEPKTSRRAQITLIRPLKTPQPTSFHVIPALYLNEWLNEMLNELMDTTTCLTYCCFCRSLFPCNSCLSATPLLLFLNSCFSFLLFLTFFLLFDLLLPRSLRSCSGSFTFTVPTPQQTPVLQTVIAIFSPPSPQSPSELCLPPGTIALGNEGRKRERGRERERGEGERERGREELEESVAREAEEMCNMEGCRRKERDRNSTYCASLVTCQITDGQRHTALEWK